MAQSFDTAQLFGLLHAQAGTGSGSGETGRKAEREAGSQPGIEGFTCLLCRRSSDRGRSKDLVVVTDELFVSARDCSQQRDLWKHCRLSAIQRHRSAVDSGANESAEQDQIISFCGL